MNSRSKGIEVVDDGVGDLEEDHSSHHHHPLLSRHDPTSPQHHFHQEEEKTYFCDPRFFTKINIFSGVMIIVFISCIIALFFVEEKLRMLFYGIITLVILFFISIVCCNRKRAKVAPTVHNHFYGIHHSGLPT
jgi:hypothetical protein